MALNFTPLKAYISEQGRNVEANRQAFEGLGDAIGGIIKATKNSRYERNKQDFFNSVGDGEIKQLDAQIGEIDARIEELEKELAGMGV